MWLIICSIDSKLEMNVSLTRNYLMYSVDSKNMKNFLSTLFMFHSLNEINILLKSEITNIFPLPNIINMITFLDAVWQTAQLPAISSTILPYAFKSLPIDSYCLMKQIHCCHRNKQWNQGVVTDAILIILAVETRFVTLPTFTTNQTHICTFTSILLTLWWWIIHNCMTLE